MPRRYTIIALAALLVGLGIGGALVAQSANAQDQQKVEPKAQKVLRALAQTISDAKQFTVDLKYTEKVDAGPMQDQSTATIRYAVARPASFSVEIDDEGDTARAVAADGKVTMYVKSLNQYTVEALPEDQPLTHPAMGMLVGGALTAPKPYDALMELARTGKYIGEEKIDGQMTDRISLDSQVGQIDLWVSRGDRALPLKVVLDRSKMVQEQFGQGTMITTVAYNNWAINKPIADERLKLDLPDDAKKVQQFGPQQQARGGDLLGNEAPDFTLEDLAGNKVTLSQAVKNNKVIVLDFWATWCGPCVRAMPTIHKVTSEHADKGVQLYAVNLREGADKINQFLNKQDLKGLPVLRDADGGVANQYGVEAIPTTVIIGPDGSVQAVHVGAAGDLEKKLTQEIQTLLKGEKLAG